MARSRYGSSSSRCFNDYWTGRPSTISNYVRTVIFLAVYLGILVMLFFARKKAGAGKRLIGLAYIGSLAFMLISYAFSLIVSTLTACEALDDMKASYDVSIASSVFSWIEMILLLYVVFYLLNMMLRKQLGQNLSVLKIVFGLDVLILGVLSLVFTAMFCNYYYHQGRGYYYRPEVNIIAAVYTSLAFDAFEVLSIIGSLAMSVLAARSLQQRKMAKTSLLIWVVVLHLSLLFTALWSLISTASQLRGGIYYLEITYNVLGWFSSIFSALAFISVIVIARNPVWESTAFDEVPNQYQSAYHQEDPVYVGARA